jgi:hypothetical protein
LQPTVGILNDALNLKDRKIMRSFCGDYNEMEHGTEVVNLLLNEKCNGTRFWNLLKMVQVDVDGDRFIFALQTPLVAYIPKVLRTRCDGTTQNEAVVQASSVFAKRINDLRNGLEERTGEAIFELVTFAEGFLNSMCPDVPKKPPLKQMVTVPSIPLFPSASLALQGQKSPQSKQSKQPSTMSNDELVLRFSQITGLSAPVPNQCIRIKAGRAVNVSVDGQEHGAMMAALSLEQYTKVQKIHLTLDLVPRADNSPMLMVTVVRALEDGAGVIIDDATVPPGITKPLHVGSTIAFSDAFVLRVGLFKDGKGKFAQRKADSSPKFHTDR